MPWPMPSTMGADQARQPAWLVLSQECDAPTLRAELFGVMRGESSDPDRLAPPTRFLEPRVALVAAGEEALRVLGMVATLATLRGGAVRSFRSFDAALAWLDEPPRPSISAR